MGLSFYPRRSNEELLPSCVVVSGRSSYKCGITACAVTLGHFNAPGALASLISWHLGQLKSGLSHHWAPVSSLALVQPNL